MRLGTVLAPPPDATAGELAKADGDGRDEADAEAEAEVRAEDPAAVFDPTGPQGHQPAGRERARGQGRRASRSGPLSGGQRPVVADGVAQRLERHEHPPPLPEA